MPRRVSHPQRRPGRMPAQAPRASSDLWRSLSLTAVMAVTLVVLRLWRASDTRQITASARVRRYPMALHPIITDDDLTIHWTLPEHGTFNYTAFVDSCALN